MSCRGSEGWDKGVRAVEINTVASFQKFWAKWGQRQKKVAFWGVDYGVLLIVREGSEVHWGRNDV